LMVDVENSGMMKRKMKNGNKDENRIKCWWYNSWA
jgi:hypothetical protein